MTQSSLRTSEDYELFLYTLTEQFVSIRRSTITFVRLGSSLARVAGEVFFDYKSFACIKLVNLRPVAIFYIVSCCATQTSSTSCFGWPKYRRMRGQPSLPPNWLCHLNRIMKWQNEAWPQSNNESLVKP
jgi:hypothetical protein